MSDSTDPPRITDCMFESLPGTLRKAEEYAQQSIAWIDDNPQSERLQGRYYSLCLEYRAIGLLKYALGYPLAEVSEACERCAESYLSVLDLRGTTPHPEVNRNAAGEKDYSLTNSRHQLFGICSALLSGREELAAQLTQREAEPRKARFVSPTSSTCRPYEVKLVRAFKPLLLGEEDGLAEKPKGVNLPMSAKRGRWMAEMQIAIRWNDPRMFLESLNALLDWHEKNNCRRTSYEFHTDIDHFLCIFGLGLSRLALDRRLIEFEDLPERVCYPRDLLL
ncbi:hypothetical protein [Blastopirellula retiformator]|uniref:Uncharacterized protein n=1 Tax=Blastopirellula retiformator TaxID=2527970 RepID=A0A5C5UUC2_9BACT|nr:hypothetical protein [Blastopirellula retiformator]TWT29698.1 hypothetical protein Enr8_48860 [Blastopirellula retiformator]